MLPIFLFLLLIANSQATNVTQIQNDLATIIENFVTDNTILDCSFFDVEVLLKPNSLFANKYEINIYLIDNLFPSYDISMWLESENKMRTLFIPFIDFTPYKLSFTKISPLDNLFISPNLLTYITYDLL